MLSSFRVRNLRIPSDNQERLLPLHFGAHDVVLSLTGREYNENSTAHPESRLKYIDDEDGEMVTVGTADELEERLNEPVPLVVRYRLCDKDGKQHMAVLPPHRDESIFDLHVFEIVREGESVRIWEDIAQRRMREIFDESPLTYYLRHPSFQPPRFMEASGQSEPAGSDDDDMSVQVGSDIDLNEQGVDTLDDLSRLYQMRRQDYLEDQHKFRFWASNPPTLSQEPINSPAIAHVFENSSVQEGQNSVGNLTLEGKRQAMHAGINLRTRVDYPNRRVQFADDTKSASSDHNRWASYGSVEAFAGPQVTESSKQDVSNINKAAECSKTLPGSLKPEVPKLYSSIDEVKKRFQPIEPLFESYMTELGKLSSETRNGNGAVPSGPRPSDVWMNPMFGPDIGQSSLLKSTYVDLYNQQIETATKYAETVNNLTLGESRAKPSRINSDRSIASVVQDFRNAAKALLLKALEPDPVAWRGSKPMSQSVTEAVKSAPTAPDGNATMLNRSGKKPATVSFTDPVVQEPVNKTARGTPERVVHQRKPLVSPWSLESTYNDHYKEFQRPRLAARNSFEAFKPSSDFRDSPNRALTRLQQSKSTSELRNYQPCKTNSVEIASFLFEGQEKDHEEVSYSETDDDYSFNDDDEDDDTSYNSSLSRGQILPPIENTPYLPPTRKSVLPSIFKQSRSYSRKAVRKPYNPPLPTANMTPLVPGHIKTAPSGSKDESDEPLHHDPTTVDAVSTCVDQLKDLGFGKVEDGGVGRLIVYAQAANGVLPDAIDMIDEEIKVYEARRSN